MQRVRDCRQCFLRGKGACGQDFVERSLRNPVRRPVPPQPLGPGRVRPDLPPPPGPRRQGGADARVGRPVRVQEAVDVFSGGALFNDPPEVERQSGSPPDGAGDHLPQPLHPPERRPEQLPPHFRGGRVLHPLAQVLIRGGNLLGERLTPARRQEVGGQLLDLCPYGVEAVERDGQTRCPEKVLGGRLCLLDEFTDEEPRLLQGEVEPLEAAPGLERCDWHAGIVPRDGRAFDPFR